MGPGNASSSLFRLFVTIIYLYTLYHNPSPLFPSVFPLSRQVGSDVNISCISEFRSRESILTGFLRSLEERLVLLLPTFLYVRNPPQKDPFSVVGRDTPMSKKRNQ
jgi:hypothetical protein